MFSFAFDIDEAELDEDLDLSVHTLKELDLAKDDAAPSTALPYRTISLSELLETLPPLVSYTLVDIPITSSSPERSTTLLRRDLFDARFQILNQDEDEDAEKQEARQTDEGTDLVKGVYEGGLKTWECSLVLVDCLNGFGFSEQLEDDKIRGKSALELGCGSALPTCAVFARLLAEIRRSPTSSDSAQRPPRTRIHVQDYNKQVLSLITLPNLILAYAHHINALQHSDNDDERQEGELELTPELLSSFEDLLERENIELEFSEGDWTGMISTLSSAEPYDVVLTSETVYSLPSLPSLLDVLQAACRPLGDSLCLVACKRIYFGVGGGELEFRRRVEERRGTAETVWGGEKPNRGVSRTVMKVEWPAT